ncbi:thermonuclease family protein [Paracoccus siganidrum]|uniref:Thermonuclease family protein n=1 Tax=Paracoccus siganidrum TaxID=1276757 RepID=A0A419A6X6_9RHOB|nr:thermonuclease family protein [Paracoccus siganidrum]RJL15811.1 thermonuclease family protein [Paracoccus siganidrum]RMC29376.1 thermonuclease family protein [Paracoccus siganidrum]
MLSHIVVSVLLCTASCEPAEIRVWDGDSVRLGPGRQGEAVRIFNIDAPEIEGRCASESDLALRSKMRLAELLRGRRIEILRQGTDRYGRTLAAIRVDGRDVGDILVSEGLARTWAGRREPWC